MTDNRIRINLLPPELAVVEKQRNKKKWIIRISSLVIVLAAVVTASILGFGIIKSTEQQSLASRLEEFRLKIATLNEEEGYLTLIRQKLATINRLKIEDSAKIATLQTFLTLIPPSVQITSTSLDKPGEITFNGQADSLNSFNSLVQNLTDPDKNSDKVAKVKFGSLSKGSGNSYRFDITLVLR